MSARPIHGLAVALITLLGVGIYSNALETPFLFDSRANILDNPGVRLDSLDLESLSNVVYGSRLENRPVAYLSFALNHYVGGYETFGYHLVNVAIHVVTGILVYLLASIVFRQLADRKDGGDPPTDNAAIAWKSLFAACLFVAHPLQVQSVTYIVQRMSSMAALFYLLAMLLYFQGLASGSGRRRWGLWAAGLVSGLLALGSKEIAATLPVMILLFRWYFFEDLGTAWLTRNAGAFVLVAGVIGAAALAYLGTQPWDEMMKGYERRDFDLGERVMTQFRVLFLYLGLWLYPHPDQLNLFHPITTSRSLLDPPTTLLSMIGVLALVGAAIRYRRRARLLSFAVLWYFGNLVIESSVVPLEMVYEHRMYLPMFGLVLAFSDRVLGPLVRRPSLGIAVASLLVLTLAVASHRRNEDWRDALTFWSDVIAKNPGSHRAHNNLGVHLKGRDRLDEASRHYERALALKPDYEVAHLNLGNLRRDQGEQEEAERLYRRAVELDPRYANAHVQLGDLLLHRGDASAARESFQAALRLQPGNAHVLFGLGVLSPPREAIRYYREALRHDPEHFSSANNLAWLLATRRGAPPAEIAEAVHWAERAAEATENADASVLDTLGVAYAASGDFERAAASAERSVALYRSGGEEDEIPEVAARLRAYRMRQPFHEP